MGVRTAIGKGLVKAGAWALEHREEIIDRVVKAAKAKAEKKKAREQADAKDV